jgi:hypothetical protein
MLQWQIAINQLAGSRCFNGCTLVQEPLFSIHIVSLFLLCGRRTKKEILKLKLENPQMGIWELNLGYQGSSCQVMTTSCYV